MKKHLYISADINLPLDAVTQKFAFIGRSGSGKTYAAGKFVEELLDNHDQVVILDPVGVWNGLRTLADGKGKGYPIPVFGGEHADLPLPHTSGSIIAGLVVEKGISAVLDVSHMRKNERKQFMTDFAEQLFFLKKKHRSPLHIVMEEAQVFVPQRIIKGEERMLGAMEDIVKLGRNYGIGISLISQRPQSVHKDCLNQTEALFAFQINGPHERKAIVEWVVDKGLKPQTVNDDLSGLETGTCFLWSPQWLRVLEKIKISKKKTFDASATPTGNYKQAKREFAPVDIEILKQSLQQTIDQVKNDDPKELKRQIAELKKELSKKQLVVKEKDHSAEFSKMIKSRINDEKMFLEQLLKKFTFPVAAIKNIKSFSDVIKLTDAKFTEVEEYIDQKIKSLNHALPYKSLRELSIKDIGFKMVDRSAGLDTIKMTPKEYKEPVIYGGSHTENVPLGTCPRAILTVLAQNQDKQCNRSMVAVSSGYSVTSGSFNNSLSKLNTSGFIKRNGENIQITPAGLDALGSYNPLPIGEELHKYYYNKLGKCGAAILKCLIDNHPKEVGKAAISEITGYSETSGSFNNNISKLRTLKLIEGYGMLKAADYLFE